MKNIIYSLVTCAIFSNFSHAANSGKLVSQKPTKGEAFGTPGLPGNWASARKVQVGTSYEGENSAKSPLWFTLAEGTLTEVYYPTIDQAQIKDSQLLISDGTTFFQQEKDLVHKTEIINASMIKLVNIDKQNRFKISHTHYSLQDAPVLIDEVEIESYVDNLNFYLLSKPQLNNTAAHDYAKINSDGFIFQDKQTFLDIQSTAGFRKKSVGFVGKSDGFQDLADNYQMDYQFDSASNGSVASMGELNLPAKAGRFKFYVIYNFSSQRKFTNSDLGRAKLEYSQRWESYLRSLLVPKNLTAQQLMLYYRSLYALRCHEDKLNPGAFIASLSVPWGESQVETSNNEIGGYHLIWPRDLFNVSVALLNSGDYQSALNALKFLKKIQYKSNSGNWNLYPRIIPKDGAWPQNTWVTGRTYWEGFQIDQTAFPIHLFYHIYQKTEANQRDQLLREFHPMLSSALSFMATYGPWTHQERWEENFGISPSSFSAAASALIIGSRIYGGTSYGDSLAKIANQWLTSPGDNIDTWTFTTNGAYGDGQYYLRIAGGNNYGASWNPNDKSSIHIANSGNRISQDQVLDQGFLQLALLGLKPANSILLIKSKDIVDKYISYQTPNGRGWYRYSFDAYGENSKGRLWPLLSGEHARFAIERYSANDLSWNQVLAETNSIVDSFIGFANSGLMIPEQVFEQTGEGTGSATPLAWAHAEYIKLLWSLEQKHNIENVLR